jgi:DUF4097 and DUF4098 domain-containing protein YvlB
MNEFQKVIKYLAIAFAVFLTVTIITGIASAVIAIVGVTTVNHEEIVDYNKSFDDVRSLVVENGVGKLTIKSTDSDQVTVEGTNVNESFVAEKSFSGELKIKSKFNFWNMFNSGKDFNQNSTIIIYLPSSFEADKVEIDAGAGNVNIEGLKTDKLDINAGVGDVYGENIYADNVSLDGGVGEITLENVELNDVDIDAGVGNIEVQGKITGRSEIDAGVGNIDLDITGSPNDYELKVDKGIGDIYIDGDKYSSLKWNNITAEYSMDINGGVGNIRLDFKE